MAAAAVNLWWWPPQVPATSCGANKFRLHRTSSTHGCWTSTNVYRHLPTSTIFIQFRSSSTVVYVITFYYIVIFEFLLLVWTISELGYMIPANWDGVDIFSSRLLTDCPIYCMHGNPSFYLQVFCSELRYLLWLLIAHGREYIAPVMLLYCLTLYANSWAMPTWVLGGGFPQGSPGYDIGGCHYSGRGVL